MKVCVFVLLLHLFSLHHQGNFGEVWRGKIKASGATVAVKKCREGVSDPEKFLVEADILRQYDHPNIVRIVGVTPLEPYYIIMELCEGGDFLNYLKAHLTLDALQLVKFCLDAAAGMTYLQSKNCVHRDLAARNCLVGENDTLKISDFG